MTDPRLFAPQDIPTFPLSLETKIHGTPVSLGTALGDAAFGSRNQQLAFPDPAVAFKYIALLREEALPIVQRTEIDQLRMELFDVAFQRKTILQVGLCAEDMDMPRQAIAGYAQRSAQMAEILAQEMENAMGLPTIPILRGAGQVAKPRSALIGPDGVPAFVGLANTERDRTPRPERLSQAYRFSKNVKRELDRHAGRPIYTSHEALSLPYEFAMTEGCVNHSAAMHWIGNRTNGVGSAHVQAAAALVNPNQLKWDGKRPASDLRALLVALNPYNEPGRTTVICRFGAQRIGEIGETLDIAREFGDSVNVMCDVMHGNTVVDPLTGKKTRHMNAIKAEARGFAKECRRYGVFPAGLHMEVSAENVTECLGDNVRNLAPNYQSLVDPCLNPYQAIQVIRAFGRAYNAA